MVIADINRAEGEKARQELSDQGFQARFFELDVTNWDSVSAAVAYTVAEFGRLDFAVNSAGIFPPFTAINAVEQADWQRVFTIYGEGVFLCMKAQLAQMITQQKGVIVNMSSGAGLQAIPTNASYCASKHAVLGLTKSAALEVAGQGISINAICPAFVDTPMTADLGLASEVITAQHPMGRIGRADEVADMILFACSDEAGFSTGIEFRLNGGGGL